MVDKVFVVSLRLSILALRSSSSDLANTLPSAYTHASTLSTHKIATSFVHTLCGRCATCNVRISTKIHANTTTEALYILHQDNPDFCNSSISSKSTSVLSSHQGRPTHQPHILLDKRLNLVEILFNARNCTQHIEREGDAEQRGEREGAAMRINRPLSKHKSN